MKTRWLVTGFSSWYQEFSVHQKCDTLEGALKAAADEVSKDAQVSIEILEIKEIARGIRDHRDTEGRIEAVDAAR